MSGRMSTNTGTPPRSTNAFAVDTNVNDGMITSSPGATIESSAAISSARRARVRQQQRFAPSICSSYAWHAS